MKNYRYLIPLVLTAVFILSIYMKYDSNQSKNREYETYLKEARENRKLEIYVDAEEEYQQALEIRPSLSLSLELGEMYLEANAERKTEDWGNWMIEQYPEDADAYIYLMDFYLGKQEYDSFFTLYEESKDREVASEYIDEVYEKNRYQYYFLDEYLETGVFSGGYCSVKSEELWGYINEKGTKTVPYVYQEAGAFSDGLAPVVDYDGETYYIDESGNKKEVVQNVDKIRKLGMAHNGISPLYDGSSWGYYTMEGKLLFGGYEEASSLGNGIAAVKKDGKWSLINEEGKELTKERFDGVIMDEKNIVYRNERLFVQKGLNYYLVDSSGKQITDQAYEDARLFQGDGYAAVKINGLWGFIDTNGKMIIDPVYEDAGSFSNGLAAVQYGSRWGYIDLENQMVIPNQFEGAKEFTGQGSAFVLQNGVWELLLLYSYNH